MDLAFTTVFTIYVLTGILTLVSTIIKWETGLYIGAIVFFATTALLLAYCLYILWTQVLQI